MKHTEETQAVVKTSIHLPVALWQRAKQRAVAERTTLRDLILEGLEMRLGQKKGGRHAR
jgi:hypothetical protein